LDDHAALFGDDISAFTTAQKESALVQASIFYIDGYDFSGDKLNDDQGLKLPTDEVEVNRDIKRAVLGAAVLQLQGRLFVDPQDIQQRSITSESKAVGSLSKSTNYAEQASYTTKYPTTNLDKLVQKHALAGGLGTVVRC
ncbi:MAG: DnaT-like ssDNA-binding protein, partial [Oleiphilaceae bacterium]|nr:DnaT-like ssDNA-binding protein [Oleiphilaceae bacterium]